MDQNIIWEEKKSFNEREREREREGRENGSTHVFLLT
jgi:hypothetical protein